MKPDVLVAQLDKAVDYYIISAKQTGVTVTRDDVINMITKKLGEMTKGPINERILVASGIAVGIAMVLTIEAKLIEQDIIDTTEDNSQFAN